MAQPSPVPGQPTVMIADNPGRAADTVNKARQCGICFRPDYSNRPDKQTVHALLHKAGSILRTAADFGPLPVVGLGDRCQRGFLYPFPHMAGVIPCFLIPSSIPIYPASGYKAFPLSSSVNKAVAPFGPCTLADVVSQAGTTFVLEQVLEWFLHP